MIAFDTSFLLAAEGRHEPRKWQVASRILGMLAPGEIIVPAQALAEMLHVLKTILRIPEEEAGEIAARWLGATHGAGISHTEIAAAQVLAAAKAISLDDALMVAAARAAGAKLLLSEDIPDGLTHDGLTVANPFVPLLHPQLLAYLGPEWVSAAGE